MRGFTLLECRMCGDEYDPDACTYWGRLYCSAGCQAADQAGANYAPTPTPDMPHANCYDAADALMFPVNGFVSRRAKAICGACVHKDECLDYGLRVKVSGVWGGAGDAERARLAKARGIEREPLIVGYLVR